MACHTRPAPKSGQSRKWPRLLADIRQAGGTIVLAHGVFDLLHMGHVRHLEEARNFGTTLIVSVTADRYVNKGPGRPAFNDVLRAEMLAALACVDWVIVSEEPSAEPVIESFKPDFYVKGVEYSDDRADVTGKIVSEREAVERYGGRSFSRMTYRFQLERTDQSLPQSSTNLRFEPFSTTYARTTSRMTILNLLDSVADKRVLIVGDTIIDDYNYVVPMGKAPKENLVVTLHQSREVFAGGAIATANHIASLCRKSKSSHFSAKSRNTPSSSDRAFQSNVTLTRD